MSMEQRKNFRLNYEDDRTETYVGKSDQATPD